MQYPKFIREKSILGVTAPSDGVVDCIKQKRLDSAISSFQELGYQIVETPNVRHSYKGKSSSSLEQAEQLRSLFLNKNVDAIFCVGGGDFLLEMLPYFDFTSVLENPKWLQGYSDPTGLLFVITTYLDIATIYGDNFKTFGMRPWHESLSNNLEILKGNIVVQKSFSKYEKEENVYVTGTEPYYLTHKVCWKNIGCDSIHMRGRIIGGCIDLLSELFGTTFDHTQEFIERYKEDGIIWYFDKCELTIDQLIRTLWKFRQNGWFRYCKGIILGRSWSNNSYYDISLEESLVHAFQGLDVPIIYDADIGHVSPRMTIINGAMAEVWSRDGSGEISFDLS